MLRKIGKTITSFVGWTFPVRPLRPPFRKKRLILEPLERRILLSADALGGAAASLAEPSPLVFDAPINAAADSYTLRFNAGSGNLDLLDGENILASQSLAATSAVLINGEDGQDDNLTIDFAFGGVFSLEDGILYNGGTGGIDKLSVVGGEFASATHSASDAGPGLSGYVSLDDGTRPALTIAYADLEPIDLSGTLMSSLTLSMSGGNDVAVLEDDGVAGNGISRLRSLNGLFESTTFRVTTGSLTINMGAGEDILTVASLPDFSGALTINGNAGTADAVIFSGTESFSALSVTVAGTIGDASGTNLAVTGNASFTGSSVTLGDNAADITDLGSLTFNSAGAVAISEDGDTALAGSSTAGSLALNTSSALTDAATGKLVVSGNATISAFSVFIADQSTNTFNVGGLASFDVPLFLTIGANGVTNFGSLTFSTSGQVFLVEDSNTVLSGTSSAESAILVSFGSLTDVAGTSLSVADFAELRAATGITLGDNATDVTNFGTLMFSSLGAVSIAEDSDMVLDQPASAAAVTLSSSGALEINAAIVATAGGVQLSGGTAVTGTAAGTITASGVQIVSGNLSGAAGEVDLAGDIDTSGADSSSGLGGRGGDVEVITRGGAITLAGIDTSGGDSASGTGGDAGRILIDGGQVTLNGGLLAIGGGSGDADNGAFGDILVNQLLSTGGQAVTLSGGLIWGHTVTIKGSSLTQDAGAAIIGIGNVTLAGVSGAVVLNDTVDFAQSSSAIGLLKVSAASTLDINAAITAFGGGVELSGGTAVRGTAAATITTEIGGVMITSGNLSGAIGEVNLAGDIDTSGEDNDFGAGANGGGVQVFTRGGAITLAGIDTHGGDSVNLDGPGGDGGSVTIEGGAVTLNGGVFARGGSDNGAFGDILVNQSLGTGGQAVTLSGGLIWGHTVTIKGSSLTQDAGAAIIGIGNVTLAGVSGAVVLNDTVDFAQSSSAIGLLKVSAASTLDINAAITAFGGGVELSGGTSVTGTAAATITTEIGGVMITSGNLSGAIGEVNLAGDIDTSGEDNDFGAGANGGGVQVITRGGAITLAGIDTHGGDSVNLDGPGGDGGSVTIEGGAVTLNGGVFARGGSDNGAFGDILVNQSLGTGGQAVTLSGGLIWGHTITIKGSSLTQDAGAPIIGIGNVTLAGVSGAVVLNDTVNFTQDSPAIGLLRVSAGSTLDINAAISTYGGSIELSGAEALRSTAAGTITTVSAGGFTPGVLATSGRFASGGVPGLAGEVDLAGSIDTTGADYDAGTGLPGGAAGGTVQVFSLGGPITVADVDTRGGSPLSGPDGADGDIAIEGGAITLTGSVHSGTSLVTLGAPSVVVADSATLNVELAGNLTFTRIQVSDQLTLDGTLHAALVDGFVPASGDRFRFMTFDSRAGSFDAQVLPAGFTVDQSDATDLELVFAPAAPAIVYVDDGFTGSTGTSIVDADPVAAGNQAAVVGVNAFATIQAGVNAVAQGGTVMINSHGPNAAPTGAYAESVSITKALTLDGNAISGLATGVVIDPAAGNGITVSGTNADDVTIRDLRVTGGVDGINATGVGNVTITNVRADGNSDDGLVGASLNTAGTVTIQNSTFSNNAGDGIQLVTVGAIVFSNVTATGNDPGVLVLGAASFSDTNGFYSHNDDDGIRLIDIAGDVTLVRTTSDDNDANNDGIGDGLNATANVNAAAIGGDLLVQGARFRDSGASDHQERGIFVQSVAGSVTFSDSTGVVQSTIVTDNESGGVRIDNGGTTGSFTNGTYSNNTGHGIELNRAAGSFSGNVTLTSVTANFNALDGVHAINLTATTTVSGGGYGANGDDGLDLTSNTVAGTDLVVNALASASGNGDAGLVAQNLAGVSVTDGIFNQNNNHGIQLTDIGGLVSLTRVTANDNDANAGGIGDGVNMVDGGDAGTEAIGSLQVVGGSFSDTAAPGAQRYGIRVGNGVGVGAVHSVGGSIVLDGVTATGNLNSGVEIEDGGTTASVSGSYSTNLGVGFSIASLSGTFMASGTFSGNGSHGLSLVDVDGAVTLSGVTANDNGGNGLNAVDGADLGTLAVGGLTMSASGLNDGVAGNAQLFGVLVGDVGGDVVFNDTSAAGNDTGGVQIGNVAGAVTFTGPGGTVYSNNGGDGVSVASLTGALTVSGISASGNAGQGLEIGAGATAASISDGTFSGNTLGDGIALGTVGGAVVLSGVTASGNTDAGVSVNGAGSFADSDGIFNGNVNHGIALTDIAGLVSLTRTTANDNDANAGGIGDGVNMVDGADAGTEAIGSLQVTDGSFNDTVAGIQRFGIRVGKVGTSVVLDDVSATGNLNSGVEIQDGGTTASVSGSYSSNLGVGFSIASLSGTFMASGTFSGNGSHGLSLVDVDGAVTLSGVTANDNGGNGLNAVDGADLGTLAVGGLTLSASGLNDGVAGNAQLFGVLVGDVGGDVVFNDTSAAGNDTGGVQIGNVAGAVTFTGPGGTVYSNNGGDGVSVASLTGALTVSGISASGNAGQGLEIGAGATAASISDGTFSGNTLGDGIALGTVGGAVVLSGVTASANLDAGVSVNGAGSFADSDGIFNGNVNHGIALTDIAGLVSLTRTTANDNDANGGGIGDGVNMVDGADAGTEAIGSLQVTDGSFNDTVAGIQRFGIRVGKVGTSVVLDGVSATGNLNSGVEIQDGGTTASVSGSYSSNLGVGFSIASLSGTFTASGTFSGNGSHGLSLVDVDGAVTLSGVTANDNGGNGLNAVDGADLDTLAVGGLTMSAAGLNDTVAGNAQLFGVLVGDVGGDVVFNDTSAAGNDTGGVQIGNVAGAVTFTGPGGTVYSNNGGDGVSVASLTGALTVSGVSASGNAGQGLEIGAGATAASISDGTFSGNTLGDGIALGTVGGAVVLSGVTASANLDAGVSVNGAGSFADSDGIFNGNVNHGIALTDIAGLVSLTRTTANDNDANGGGIGDGVNMVDGADAGTEAIGSLQVTDGSFNDTVAGIQRFGIRVGKVGTSVVLDGVSATGNLNSGVEIQDGGTTATISGTFSNNGGDGINVVGLSGLVFLGDVVAVNNGGDAIDLSTSGTITIAGTLDVGVDNVALTAAGGVAVDSGAVLLVDLAGTAAGQYTTFTISGAVTLDGTLEAELVGGFVPTDGDRFTFMTFGSRDGFFASTILPADFIVDQSAATTLVLEFAPNDPPVATNDSFAIDEDSVLSVTAANGLLGNDTDPDVGDTIVVSAVNGQSGNVGTTITLASGALLKVNADGSFTYDANHRFEFLGVGQSASDSFTYLAADADGALSNTATVTITIAGVNDAPVFTQIGPRTVEEGHQLRFTVNATDVDSPTLSYSASGLPAGATFNPTTHEFAWTPQDDASTAVTFTVSDGQGGQDVMTVPLKATNVAPVVDAGADQVVGLQDIKDHDKDDKCDKDDKHDKDKPEAEVRIAALFDDAGLKDTHTATINWGDGSATVAGKVTEPTATTDGAVTGKHTYTKTGTYTVTVTVRDDDGGVRTDTLKVTVKAPVEKKNFDTKGDEYKLNEDTVLRVNAANGVLDNDRLPGVPVQARVVEGPEHGRLTFNADGSFVYVPERDFHGKDSFWYEFTDGTNVSQAVEVKLDVKEVKDNHARPCIDWEDSWNSCPSDRFQPFGKTRWC